MLVIQLADRTRITIEIYHYSDTLIKSAIMPQILRHTAIIQVAKMNKKQVIPKNIS